MKKLFFLPLLFLSLLSCDQLKRDVSPFGNIPDEIPDFYVEPGKYIFIDEFYFYEKRPQKLSVGAIGLKNVNVGGSGSSAFFYKFKDDFRGTEEFYIKINGKRSNKITVHVKPESEFPCDAGSIDDFSVVKMNTETEIDVLKNDKLCNIDVQRIEIVNANQNLFKVVGKKIIYTPKKDFLGSETVLYRVVGNKNGKTVFYISNIRVRVMKNIDNCQPEAFDDFMYIISTLNNEKVMGLQYFGLGHNFLRNDFFCSNDTKINFKIIEQPKFGEIQSFSSGPLDFSPQISYKPTKQGSYNDLIKYEICDNGKCNQASVFIRVVEKSENCKTQAKSDEVEISSKQIKQGVLRFFPLQNDDICGSATNHKLLSNSSNFPIDISPYGEATILLSDSYRGKIEFEYSFDEFSQGSTPTISTHKATVKITVKD